MRAPRLAALVLPALLAGVAGGCVSFHERAGVPLDPAMQERILPGRTTRAEVLEQLGPPTGLYDANLLALLTRVGQPLSAPWSPTRVENDVFAWQEVIVDGRAVFFPILFFWVDASITSRTLVVFFDGDGMVLYSGYREDRS